MSDRCQICGDVRPRSLEEHHILPRRFGGGDYEDNLVTLCASCHRALESIYDKHVRLNAVLPATHTNQKL